MSVCHTPPEAVHIWSGGLKYQVVLVDRKIREVVHFLPLFAVDGFQTPVSRYTVLPNQCSRLQRGEGRSVLLRIPSECTDILDLQEISSGRGLEH